MAARRANPRPTGGNVFTPMLSTGYDCCGVAISEDGRWLTAEGYEVRRVDSEDGMIEVYALKDGARLELYLDSDLNIVKTKGED